MRKIFPYILLCSLWLPGAGQAQTLNVLTWEAYFSEALISAWEARTGATVNQIVFDNDEVRNTMLGTVRPGTLDLVTIDKVSAPLFGERGILVPVAQYSGTENLRHLAPRWVESCGSFATPYLWGTMGLVYRRDILPQAPDSWRALLQPEAALIGHVGLLDNYIDTLAPSLILREASISTDDEALLSEVYDELRALLPSVLTFDYALTFVGRHPQADSLHLALAYSGDERELNRLSGTDHWAYAVPQEGTALWIDCLAVVANSSNQALAMAQKDQAEIMLKAQKDQVDAAAKTEELALKRQQLVVDTMAHGAKLDTDRRKMKADATMEAFTHMTNIADKREQQQKELALELLRHEDDISERDKDRKVRPKGKAKDE